MIDRLAFDLDLIRGLAEGRTALLTSVFQLFTFLGDVEGYILLVGFIHVACDKRLACRLAVLALLMMSLNHVLKLWIANPRPFVAEGSYAQWWAVSAARAQELATEYSTPSGHAMAGGAFFAYLAGSVRKPYFAVACVALILLTGLSRPYLGVHYLEDVLIGWPIGIAFAVLCLKYDARFRALWGRLPQRMQVGIVIALAALLWSVTSALGGPKPGEPPLAIVNDMGFLTGIAIAAPLEARRVGFDPRSASVAHKLLRYAVGVALVLGTLELLDVVFAAVSDDASPLGILLRWVRYATAGVVGLYVAPAWFVKLGWAERAHGAPLGVRDAACSQAVVPGGPPA